MAAQYDIVPGLDLTALSTASFAQIQQAIAQLGPLANIGGVIYSATLPDVANNARFARYLWIDVGVSGSPTAPVWKLYDGTNWNLATLSAGSVTNSIIANYAVSVLNASSANKIAYKHDASAVGAKANYLLRLDAAGQYVEVVALSTILAADTVPLTAIQLAPTARAAASYANKILSFDSGGANIGFYAFSDTLIADGTLSGTKLADASVTNAKLIDDSITLAKTKVVGVGTVGQVPTVNAGATALAYATPTVIQQLAVKTITPTAVAALANTGGSAIVVGDGTDINLSILFAPKKPATSYLEIEVNAVVHSTGDANVGMFVHDGTTIVAAVSTTVYSSALEECGTLNLRAIIAASGGTKTYTAKGWKNGSTVTFHENIGGNYSNKIIGLMTIKEVDMASFATLP